LAHCRALAQPIKNAFFFAIEMPPAVAASLTILEAASENRYLIVKAL